jgi:hypothetical protein
MTTAAHGAESAGRHGKGARRGALSLSEGLEAYETGGMTTSTHTEGCASFTDDTVVT